MHSRWGPLYGSVTIRIRLPARGRGLANQTQRRMIISGMEALITEFGVPCGSAVDRLDRVEQGNRSFLHDLDVRSEQDYRDDSKQLPSALVRLAVEHEWC
jgi:hypothetical protein